MLNSQFFVARALDANLINFLCPPFWADIFQSNKSKVFDHVKLQLKQFFFFPPLFFVKLFFCVSDGDKYVSQLTSVEERYSMSFDNHYSEFRQACVTKSRLLALRVLCE